METNNQSNSKPRRRAHKPDGKFQGDNPDTPNLNEAWEPVDISETVKPKQVKYSVRQKVEGTSNPSSGKYSKKSNKVRPTFGNVTSITH